MNDSNAMCDTSTNTQTISEADRRYAAEIGIDVEQAIRLVCQLIDTKSATGHEDVLAARIVTWAREHGLKGRLQPLGPGRANAIVSCRGSGKGPTLLLNGHMDTSSTGDEEHLIGLGYKPKAIVRDGWLFGLGAVNMKSGLAAALMATYTILKSGNPLSGDIIVGAVAGEIEKTCIDQFQGPEYTGYGYGTTQLLSHGVSADHAVVCEPTDFQPSHGQLGALWIKVTIPGDTRHTAFFDEKNEDHAIYKAACAIEAIRLWGKDYQIRNMYEGQPACIHVGAVNGGWPWRISRTPSSCSLFVDIRINPKQHPEDVIREFKDVVVAAMSGRHSKGELEFEPYVIVPSIVADENGLIFDAVRAAHESAFGEQPQMLFRGPMADFGHINAMGIPTVLMASGQLEISIVLILKPEKPGNKFGFQIISNLFAFTLTLRGKYVEKINSYQGQQVLVCINQRGVMLCSAIQANAAVQ